VERTVPSTASEEVDLYIRTYYSLLRSSAEVKIRTLEEAHTGMHSLLHPDARSMTPDIGAFIYCLLRLPECMPAVSLVVLGQSSKVFSQEGYWDDQTWVQVSAPARRRRCYFNGHDTLACFIASRSDIDDVIPLLTAYQIEWNKLHMRLGHAPDSLLASRLQDDPEAMLDLARTLQVDLDDLERLASIWGGSFGRNLQILASSPRDLGVRLLSGSLSEYRRATHAWWENIELANLELTQRPVYFISSNTHSVLNLLSGYALLHRDELVEFLQMPDFSELRKEWQDIQSSQVPSREENFLYYALKKCQQSAPGVDMWEKQLAYELEHGMVRVPSEHYFDVEAQVIDLSKLDPGLFDPRLLDGELSGLVERLSRSNALILNIDYPLGLSAYNILSVVAENVDSILGIYVMGKAATLNAVVGDVMISNVVHDEHSKNTYLFSNSFRAADVAPYLVYGTVLDNQKTVTVQGTFLQNERYMDVFYREGYTDIEMEAGGYLSAVYEMFRPQRHPTNEIVNLYELPFDLGMVHYASDTPLSKGRNLGAGSLSYFGMDSTYAATLAILRRILSLEARRIPS
jgi:hypothetical protein